MWERELKIAKIAARLAGKAVMEIYENFSDYQVEYKSDKSPLTVADKTSNRIIVEILAKHFPTYAILSEEEKDNLSRLENPLCFVVDPLDGTKEFIKRNREFTINIALAHEHISEMGVIYVPAMGELYYSSKGNTLLKKSFALLPTLFPAFAIESSFERICEVSSFTSGSGLLSSSNSIPDIAREGA